jgi:hypothetical protein
MQTLTEQEREVIIRTAKEGLEDYQAGLFECSSEVVWACIADLPAHSQAQREALAIACIFGLSGFCPPRNINPNE